MDRFWEAHDFILKAMTTHDESVQLGRRVFPLSPGQRLAAGVAGSASAGLVDDRLNNAGARARRARLRHGDAGTGYGTRKIYDAYRKGYLAKHGKAPGADRFAYLGLVAVAHDREEARKRGELIAGYLRTSPIVHLPFRNPPGYLPPEDNAPHDARRDAAAHLHKRRQGDRHADRQRR